MFSPSPSVVTIKDDNLLRCLDVYLMHTTKYETNHQFSHIKQHNQQKYLLYVWCLNHALDLLRRPSPICNGMPTVTQEVA